MFIPRLPLVLATVVAVLFGAVWLGDSIVASRVERSISTQVEEAAGLEVSPRVAVGGAPYLAALITGEIPTIGVTALDVEVSGLGAVNAKTTVSEVVVSAEQVFSGEIAGSTAAFISRTISLDGVSLGTLLDMTDLDISNPYDISPSGGSSSEARLTGTPPGFDEPVTVIVDLRLVGSEFQMTPRELVDVPQDRETDARTAFTYSLDTHELPLAGQASSVSLVGGSIYFEAQRLNVTVQMADLSPIATSES
ncbi:DUF2993 domain-containing protein [Corynebacterium alimapuense]|uniref:DUF2993 domain-containing protein n=1 Tax=Corynebacterium alimapuense TaxID=1576874 RepID=A0A3M8KBZ0_9CORY|nr:DUF2993 domain-containing protein [Corynebacterium alimapuense]